MAKIPILEFVWAGVPDWPSTEDVAVEYLETGISSSELGEKYGIPHDFVLECLRYHYVPIKHCLPFEKKLVCSDGHLVRSSLELEVDNFLHEHDIEHKYDPKLPFGNGQLADFLVGDYYIEVWGLVPHKPNPKNALIAAYLAKMERKKKNYAKHGLSLIELFPRDIPQNLDEKLGFLRETRPP